MPRELSVDIVGRGKVGAGLARALRKAGARVRLRAARAGLPARPFAGDLLVLAVRDATLAELASTLAARRWVSAHTAVVHCAGALGPEALASLRGVASGVAQMHPMISFASPDAPPTLARGNLHVDGDAAAVRVARRVGRLLGMTPRTVPGLDRVAYHAAAGLVANGAAALAAGGAELLASGGVDAVTAAAMLGPLLRSVADNVERLGLPGALTGPVRRGDARAVLRHRDLVASRVPHLAELYMAMARAQLPLARALGDAPAEAFDDVARALGLRPRAG